MPMAHLPLRMSFLQSIHVLLARLLSQDGIAGFPQPKTGLPMMALHRPPTMCSMMSPDDAQQMTCCHPQPADASRSAAIAALAA